MFKKNIKRNIFIISLVFLASIAFYIQKFYIGPKNLKSSYKDIKGASFIRSEWQKQVEKNFESKRSGVLVGQDKTGRLILLSYLFTNVYEPEFARFMDSVSSLCERTFFKLAFQFEMGVLKLNPKKVYEIDQLNELRPFFENGVESVDWAAVEKIFEKIFLKRYKEVESEKEKENLVELANSIVLLIVASDRETGDKLGFVSFQIDNDYKRGAVVLEPLAVVPEAQNKGIGKLLVASIFKLIPEVTSISLVTGSRNEQAIRAYQAWGFVFGPDPKNTKFSLKNLEYKTDKSFEYKTEKSYVLQKVAKTLI